MMALTRWLIEAQKIPEVSKVTWKYLAVVFQCMWLSFLLLMSPAISKLAQSSVKVVFKYEREISLLERTW